MVLAPGSHPYMVLAPDNRRCMVLALDNHQCMAPVADILDQGRVVKSHHWMENTDHLGQGTAWKSYHSMGSKDCLDLVGTVLKSYRSKENMAQVVQDLVAL